MSFLKKILAAHTSSYVDDAIVAIEKLQSHLAGFNKNWEDGREDFPDAYYKIGTEDVLKRDKQTVATILKQLHELQR